MNINTIVIAIRDVVAASTTIKAWTQATYSKDHKVYVGTDARREPAQSDYPLVKIFPAAKQEGHYLEDMTHRIQLLIGIYQEGKVSGLAANVIEFSGVAEIESFRQLVRDAAVAAIVAQGGNVSVVDTVYEAIEFFPFFMAAMDVEIRQVIPLGGKYFD